VQQAICNELVTKPARLRVTHFIANRFGCAHIVVLTPHLNALTLCQTVISVDLHYCHFYFNIHYHCMHNLHMLFMEILFILSACCWFETL